MVRVVVDSTADIPIPLREELGIVVVPLTVQFGEQSFRDSVDMTPDQFYARLTSDTRMPTTSQPSPGAFLETYSRLAQETDSIISIHISAKLSGTFQAAEQGATMLQGARVALIDSAQTAMGLGFMAVAAARAAREGRSLDEIEALVRGLVPRSFLYAGLDTLTFLERGGRIGRMRAFLGTLLSVKPILSVRNGEVYPVEQVRTAKRLPPRLMELAATHKPIESLSVLYTSDPKPAHTLIDLCVSSGLMPREQIVLSQMGPVVGTHVGPGAVGVTGIWSPR